MPHLIAHFEKFKMASMNIRELKNVLYNYFGINLLRNMLLFSFTLFYSFIDIHRPESIEVQYKKQKLSNRNKKYGASNEKMVHQMKIIKLAASNENNQISCIK